MAAKAAPVFQDYGALRVVEAWGDDTQDGKLTDYNRATLKQPDEKVVFSWIEWPDKATRDAGWAKAMHDERMKPPAEMPMDSPFPLTLHSGKTKSSSPRDPTMMPENVFPTNLSGVQGRFQTHKVPQDAFHLTSDKITLKQKV